MQNRSSCKSSHADSSQVLCFWALLLATGPAAYCFVTRGRAELADVYRSGAHVESCEAEAMPHHRPVLYGTDYMDEVASGGLNGLLMMMAAVCAGIGIDLPGPMIMAMATASLVSYSFSMGFGAFMAGENILKNLEKSFKGLANSDFWTCWAQKAQANRHV